MKYTFNEEEHVHLLGEKPLKGTTTIINEVYPPPLAWYGAGKALEALGFIAESKEKDKSKRRALAEAGQVEAQKAAGMTLDEYIKWLDYQYRAHDRYKKERGKAGTDMHAEIEGYIKECIERNGGKPITGYQVDNKPAAVLFENWAKKEVDLFLWSEAHCYSEKLWVGGICDFGFVHKNGKVIIGDAKPSVYPKHFIQTGGYSIQIKENGLFDDKGKDIPVGIKTVDGFCIFDYNKGEAHYLAGEWVGKLEADFAHTVAMYDRKDLIGDTTL